MRVIDARSGKDMKIGDTVEYGDGESTTLLDVYPGLFSASALIRMTYRDFTKSVTEPTGEFDEMEGMWADGRHEVARVERLRVVDPGPLVSSAREVPLTVRWLHPSFFLQHVAFINS